METREGFQFEIIRHLLSSSFRFSWIPMLLVYGHYNIIPSVRGLTLDVRIWRLKSIPALKGVNMEYIMASNKYMISRKNTPTHMQRTQSKRAACTVTYDNSPIWTQGCLLFTRKDDNNYYEIITNYKEKIRNEHASYICHFRLKRRSVSLPQFLRLGVGISNFSGKPRKIYIW